MFKRRFLEHQKKKTYTYPSNDDILAVHAVTDYISTQNRAFGSSRLEQREVQTRSTRQVSHQSEQWIMNNCNALGLLRRK
jgi:hypothetical protein